MVQAWESQQSLNEDFCNTEFLDMPTVLEIIHEHLSPSHPAYQKEAIFLAYPEVGSQRKHWLSIWKFYVEWKLARAVVDRIVKQGVAVPPDWILTTHAIMLKGEEECIPDFMAEIANKWWLAMSQNARTIWLCRWRKTWGLKFGALQPRGYLLAEDVHKKASFQKKKQDSRKPAIHIQNRLVFIIRMKKN